MEGRGQQSSHSACKQAKRSKAQQCSSSSSSNTPHSENYWLHARTAAFREVPLSSHLYMYGNAKIESAKKTVRPRTASGGTVGAGGGGGGGGRGGGSGAPKKFWLTSTSRCCGAGPTKLHTPANNAAAAATANSTESAEARDLAMLSVILLTSLSPHVFAENRHNAQPSDLTQTHARRRACDVPR